MVCTNNKLTKIANIDEFWFALIFGLIISMIVIPLIVSNISVIEKNFIFQNMKKLQRYV